MEEDDDNFLAEVIDFGDGRQYTVQHTSDDPRTVPPERPSEAGGDQSDDPTVAPSPPLRKEDRFSDDFDRSWPPSKPIPSDTVLSGQSPLSPNGSSKVLFNDRSNKLEPYSGRQNSHSGRRGNRDLHSPVEARGGRDLPPHTPHMLQKHDTSSQRQRRPGNTDPPRLDTSVGKSGWREGHSPSSSITSSHPSSIAHGQPRRWSRDEGPGRRPSMSNGHPTPRDFMRPPPSSTISPSSPSRSPQLLREERLPQTHSPSLSVRSLSSSAHPAMSPVIDNDEILQAAMHNAAERARIRRQQEEQEREKERERARKKAEELAAKMEAQKTEASAAEVGKKRSLPGGAHELSQTPSAPTPEITKIARGRSPSLCGTPGDAASPHPLFTRRQQPTDDAVVSQSDSWRAHAAPLPPLPPTTAAKHRPLAADNDLDSLSIKEGEDVETVDFSDLGKLIGGPEGARDEPKPAPPDPITVPSTDLADTRDREPLIPAKGDTYHWRRKQEEPNLEPGLDGSKSRAVELTIKTDGASARSSTDPLNQPFVPSQRSPRTSAFREVSMNSLDDTLSRIKGALDHMHGSPPPEERKSVTTESQQPRSQPSTPVVPLQTLKPEPPKPSRWLPPALRPRDHVSNPFGLDVEEYVTKQPLSVPSSEVATVAVPKVVVARGPLTRRQLGLSKCPANGVRWDILTWDPPVEGMSKRDFSLNEVLFRKPIHIKGKYRPRVKIPRSDNPRFRGSGKGTSTGAFGRPRGVDDAQTWRRSEPLPEVTEVPEPANALDTVSVSPPPVSQDEIKASKSPAILAPQLPAGSSEAINQQKIQKKILVGEDVAFYRTRVDAPNVETAPVVSFTVSSELDDSSRPEAKPSVSALAGSPAIRVLEATVDSPVPALSQSQRDSKSSDASVRSRCGPSRCMARLLIILWQPETAPITPPQQHANGTWSKSPLSYRMKESPSRAPDPEHLKIVWSKSETKDPLPSVNSLEGIADDLANVPFSLQDVKSEDGETPPPTAPSRMSLSEVTRAFQRVPASSRPPPPLPSTVSSPPERQHNFTGQPPAQQQTNRPSYGPTYPPPLTSHSPAPGPAVYAQGSPVPSRMVANGHGSPYMHPQAMWVQVQQGPPAPGQAPGSMMRPIPSPFPNQVVTYHPGMYGGPPPPMTNGGIPQQPNGVHPSQGRGRGGMGMLSPIMAPANAVPPPHQAHPGMMYPPSPALMQPQLGAPGYPPHMQQHPGGNGGVGRGQMRNGYDGMHGMHGHPPPPHPPLTPGQGPPQPLHSYPMSPYQQPW
jgi:serine/arginine repetitive matrix protein 2